MSSEKKNRRYSRVGLPKGILVAWEHSGVRKTSRVSVLALGGLFISTPEPPPNGDTIRLIFEIPGGEVRARALVRDSTAPQGNGCRVHRHAPGSSRASESTDESSHQNLKNTRGR